MARIALALAFAAMLAAGLPSPGLYLALGLGISAIGTGLVGFGRRGAPGGARHRRGRGDHGRRARRSCSAAARVAVALAAIDRIGHLIG